MLVPLSHLNRDHDAILQRRYHGYREDTFHPQNCGRKLSNTIIFKLDT